MQSLRGTKDILQEDIALWQHIYKTTLEILSTSNYYEIRTPIIESTSLFQRSIGEETDIINKEMYTFSDQGNRSITLRPEGTASIARAFISNKLYQNNTIKRLWYLGPMFRYERPQNGRQRQFHQLGIECLGSLEPIADIEVIRLADKILKTLNCSNCKLEINSIGNIEDRLKYSAILTEYLLKYEQELDRDSLSKLKKNPLRILDTKNTKIQEILDYAPTLTMSLNKESLNHFESICNQLNYLNIPYKINQKLVRGLDYYNYTAFEIKSSDLGSQDTICGGGRYDKLIEQLGGPKTPAVGWAIGIERLILSIKNKVSIQKNSHLVYVAVYGEKAKQKIWDIIQILENNIIKFELNLQNISLQKQITKAYKVKANVCIILADNEIQKEAVTLRWLNNNSQETIPISHLAKKLDNL